MSQGGSRRAQPFRFSARLAQSRKVTVLMGAGVSAESGVPTFRGEGGLYRRYEATSLATPEAWERDAGLVWEFYNYRTERVRGSSRASRIDERRSPHVPTIAVRCASPVGSVPGA
jgi:hypothetical protein